MEDEEHMFAGGCPFMFDLYTRTEFRRELSAVCIDAGMSRTYKMEEDVEWDEFTCLSGIKLTLFASLIKDEHDIMFPEII